MLWLFLEMSDLSTVTHALVTSHLLGATWSTWGCLWRVMGNFSRLTRHPFTSSTWMCASLCAHGPCLPAYYKAENACLLLHVNTARFATLEILIVVAAQTRQGVAHAHHPWCLVWLGCLRRNGESLSEIPLWLLVARNRKSDCSLTFLAFLSCCTANYREVSIWVVPKQYQKAMVKY